MISSTLKTQFAAVSNKSTGAESPAQSAPDKKEDNKRNTKKRPAPFSLRLSADERAWLEQEAGNQPLGAYIRQQLLGERMQSRRASRRPKQDDQHIAALLQTLGESRLSSNLNQLAHHANTGSLTVSQEVEQELHDAYKTIITMRDTLMMALGLRA